MNELKVIGKQEFMGKDIPVVLGGFGEGKKCVSDKTIAEIHNITPRDVRKAIIRNEVRFKEAVDFIDLKRWESDDHLLKQLEYTSQQILQAERIYILSERGYAKLIKIMDTDLAWEIHDKLIDEYFELRENQQNIRELSPQLQFLINMELEQKRQAERLQEVDSKLDSLKEVVALSPTQWRKDSSSIINKIALKLGGYEHIRAIREESYKLLEQRMGVALNIRLTNKKKTMALNGICKSKLDKLNQLDVISDDKKLVEGYIAIVKELSIKYGAV